MTLLPVKVVVKADKKGGKKKKQNKQGNKKQKNENDENILAVNQPKNEEQNK